MLELRNVSKFYHNNDITNIGLKNVSLTLNKGEIVAITGNSGSGKSTLLNVITKIDSFDEGEIYYKGNETSYFSIDDMDDFRKDKIGFIFQNYNIIDSYTVLENIMLPLILKGIPKIEAKAKAIEIIEKVGLRDRVYHRGIKLSGGEKQRCVIARALVSDCEILACDEPTGNLDSKTSKEIIKLIKEVASNKLVLIVTHDYDQVKDIVTRKITINDGEIVEDNIITNYEKDPDIELNLDYKPLNKKACLRVGLLNIKFTPKKTILLSLILFSICFIVLFFYQLIFISNLKITYIGNNYIDINPNRIQVYNINHTELNKDDFSSYNALYNSFSIDKQFTMSSNNKLLQFNSYYGNDYNLTYGSDDLNDNELVLVIPSSNNAYIAPKDYLDLDLTFINKYISNEKYTIKGIATSSNIKEYSLYSKNPSFYNNANRNVIIDNISSNINLTTDYKNQTTTFVDYIINLSNDITKPTIYILGNNIYNKEDITLKLFNLYNLDFDIKTDPQSEYSYTLLLLPLDISNNNIFEVNIYSKNVKTDKSNFEKLGYTVDQVSSVMGNNEILNLINKIGTYSIILSSSVSLIIVFFITYFILAKIYQSRKKDYAILRTLGVSKRDMKKIVYSEIITISFSIIIFTYILFVILIYNCSNIDFLTPITLESTLIYFIVMCLFSFAVGHRFNKRLFKFTVASNLKEGK